MWNKPVNLPTQRVSVLQDPVHLLSLPRRWRPEEDEEDLDPLPRVGSGGTGRALTLQTDESGREEEGNWGPGWGGPSDEHQKDESLTRDPHRVRTSRGRRGRDEG